VATYIPAPYTAADATELTAKFLEPKFYENENGPTIGVTLLGVIEIGGQYFRDLNNNKELDTFEDWRLDADTRAEAFAAAMTDDHLVYRFSLCADGRYRHCL
jgi:beta-glucosidase